MGIFDLFTGAPAVRAAGQQRALFDRTQDQGRTDLSAGYNTGVGAVTAGNQAGRADLAAGYNTGVGGINQGYGDAQGFLTGGANAARNAFSGAGGAYDSLAALGQKYAPGTSTYLDSLGVNGAAGNTRAQAAFQPSMAYNFNRDQGLESIMRLRNAQSGGNGVGGNTDRDAQEYGAGLASREFGGWQDRLAGLINPEMAATSGAASGKAQSFNNLGNLESTLGRDQSGAATNRGAMLADLARIYGQGTGASHIGEGNTLASLAGNEASGRVGLATNLAQPYANTYRQEGEARLAGQANIARAGMAAAQAAMGMPPTALSGIGSNPSSQGVSNASNGGMFGGSDLSQSQMGGGAGGAAFNSQGQPLYGGGGGSGFSFGNMFGGW